MFINPGVFLFSDYDHIDKKSALLKLDNFTNHFDGMRSMDFDFQERITVLIGANLYTFHNSQLHFMVVERYEQVNLIGREFAAPKSQKLATADHSRYKFSAAAYEMREVYITGGFVNGRESKSVLRFSISDDTFVPVADLNLPINYHGSTIAGDNLYVIGFVIEVLDLSAENAIWQFVNSDNYSGRTRPCVVALSTKQVLIMGGYEVNSCTSEFFMLETGKGEVRKVKGAPFKFQAIDGNNQTLLERTGVVLSYVQRESFDDKVLFRYDQKSFDIIGEHLDFK